MDKILIKGLKIFAFHGAMPEEKVSGQSFILDITLYMSLKKACTSDALNDTVDYAAVVQAAAKAMLKTSYNLIERAAQAVADAILEEFNAVQTVELLLKKPDAPISAEFDYVAVSITRSREGLEGPVCKQ
ncbi:MAG: dihydroneopterin aldolase [Oscillospiraceae bacterium]|jgi:dihydroneopterin aldolase|nr:dihydroneopterin aldolase [Oscillospiraceae bacterium]